MARYRRTVWLDKDLRVKSGDEWHSVAIPLLDGDVITLSAYSKEPFYAGLFDRSEYFRRGGPSTEMFDFEFGTDTDSYTQRKRVTEPDDYYAVFRVGVFTDDTTIHVKIEIHRPD